MNEDFNTDTDKRITTYFLEDGTETLEIPEKEVVCAKCVATNDTPSYYILCNNGGQMFNPGLKDSRYISRYIWKFKRVKGTVFNLYVKFLIHKYRSLLYQAERAM